jgi:hypothetical protein
MKWKIYRIATKIYDWNIPGLTWIADKVRDYTFEDKK